MSNGITKANLMRAAPNVLVDDGNMFPLVDTLADALAKLAASCRLATIYPRIDELPEDLLDILAKDFKVDWYDYNYNLETKRKVIKDSFFVHRHMGTRAAVETAVCDVWPSSHIEEWFEYGGDPYHFRVITSEEYDAKTEQNIKQAISLFKNARSTLDAIVFNSGSVTATLNVAAAVCGVLIEDEVRML